MEREGWRETEREIEAHKQRWRSEQLERGFRGWAADEEAWEVGNGGVIHSEQEQSVEKKEDSGCVCEEEMLGVEEGSHVCAWRACFPKDTCCPGGPLCFGRQARIDFLEAKGL